MIHGAHVIFSKDAEADRRFFRSAVERQAWGAITRSTLPGGGKLGNYQPRHASPLASSNTPDV